MFLGIQGVEPVFLHHIPGQEQSAVHNDRHVGARLRDLAHAHQPARLARVGGEGLRVGLVRAAYIDERALVRDDESELRDALARGERYPNDGSRRGRPALRPREGARLPPHEQGQRPVCMIMFSERLARPWIRRRSPVLCLYDYSTTVQRTRRLLLSSVAERRDVSINTTPDYISYHLLPFGPGFKLLPHIS